MKKWKKCLALFTAMAFALMLSACGGSGSAGSAGGSTGGNSAEAADSGAAAPEAADSGAAQEGGKGTIAVTIPTSEAQFCYDFALGVKAAAEENGYEGVIHDPSVQLDVQISAIENFTNSGVKGLVVFPVDGQGVSDVVQAAMDSGILVAAYDNVTPCNILVAEDEHQTGYTIAQGMADWVNEHLDGTAKIALIPVNEAEDSHNGRILTGLLDGIEELLPNCEIVSTQKSTDASEAMSIVETIVQANPDVQVIFSQLDNVIVSEALTAVGYNRDDICLVGAAANNDELALMSEGSVYRTAIATDIYNAGYNAAMAIINQLENGEVTETVPVEYEIVTQENAADFME